MIAYYNTLSTEELNEVIISVMMELNADPDVNAFFQCLVNNNVLGSGSGLSSIAGR